MDNLLTTIIAAVILMGLVVVGLSIGLILTGKSRLKKGCGLTPKQKKEGETNCSLCGEKKDECDKQ